MVGMSSKTTDDELRKADRFHRDATVARVAAITELADGEFYIMLGEGDGECTCWLLSEDLARRVRRAITCSNSIYPPAKACASATMWS